MRADAQVCGDVDLSGGVSAADLGALRSFLANPGGQPLSPTGQTRCSVIGVPTSCDIVDAVVLSRALGLRPPGISQSCGATLAGTRSIGATGGSFTFPSGIALDVPAGALAALTNVTITPLPCNQVEVVLSGAPIISHPKGCLFAFLAEPTGLGFAAPVTVSVPQVPVPSPRSVPIQAIVDLASATYSLEPTQIDYDNGAVEFQIDHFSTHALSEVQRESQEWDRRCQSCTTFADPDCTDGDPVTADQPACCGLTAATRVRCGFTPQTCDCCRDRRVRVVQRDLSTGGTSGCEIASREIESQYLDCVDTGPFVDTLSEVTDDCPANLRFETQISPGSGNLHSCEGLQLHAFMSAFAPSGSAVFLNREFLPFWKAIPKTAGYMKGGERSDGTLRGSLVSGAKTVSVTAPLSLDEAVAGRTTIHTASFQVTALSNTSFAGLFSGSLEMCVDPDDDGAGSLLGTLLMSSQNGPSANLVLGTAGRPLILAGALIDTGTTCLFDSIGTYQESETKLTTVQTIEGNALVTGTLDEQLALGLSINAQDTVGDTCSLTGVAALVPGRADLLPDVVLPSATYGSICLSRFSSAVIPFPDVCANSGCYDAECTNTHSSTGSTESRVGPFAPPSFLPATVSGPLAARLPPGSGMLLASGADVFVHSTTASFLFRGSDSTANVELAIGIDTIAAPPFTVLSVPVRLELIGEGEASGQASSVSYDYTAVLDGDVAHFTSETLGAVFPGLSVAVETDINAAFSAGCDVETTRTGLGFSSAHCAAAMVPIFKLDQAAFDAQYGALSFPLASHYAIRYSPNATAP